MSLMVNAWLVSSKHTLICAGLAALVVSLPALAGRPLQTDDAGMLERSDCELEGATLRESAGRDRSTESSLQLRAVPAGAAC